MSAYILSPRHIDAMVRFAIGRDGIPHDMAEVTGQMLMRENIASVSYRYPSAAEGGDLPGPVPTPVAEEFRISFAGPNLTPVQMLKALSCYEYQSCEHPGWETSEAKRLCARMRSLAITRLPGYEAAEWAID